MCLYPIYIKNPKYQPNKKNKGSPPELDDIRKYQVLIGCGKCEECMRQRADQWRVRLLEEIKTDKTGVFVTLTFNQESLQSIENKADKGQNHQENSDNVAKYAIRHFLERWRKKYRKSVKHWLITELGHEGTERLHIHGLIFTENQDDIVSLWGYGYVYLGSWVNEQTINYVIKYCTKQDKDHPNWRGKIFCSAGLGKSYLSKGHDKTQDYYRDRKGFIHALPLYYKNKIYTEKEREQMWMDKLTENIRYCEGHRFDCKTKIGLIGFKKQLEHAQKESVRKGYGKRKVKH